MKAIKFPEVNVLIAETRPEYETLPVNMHPDKETNGYFNNITMCFELNEEELKQIAKTGKIWMTVIQPKSSFFHPLRMSTLKPEMK